MGRFARKHPDVQLKTVVEQSRTIDAMLVSGNLDIGVVQVFVSDVQKIDVIVKKDTLVWIGPQDHDLSKHSHLPFIAFDQNVSTATGWKPAHPIWGVRCAWLWSVRV